MRAEIILESWQRNDYHTRPSPLLTALLINI